MLFKDEEYVEIASQYLHNGSPKYAWEYVNKAININSSIASAWLLKGNIETERKQFSDAMDSYSRCIDLDETISDAHFYKAQIAYEMEDYTLALTHVEKAVTLVHGYRDDYYYTLVQIYAVLKDYENVIKYVMP